MSVNPRAAAALIGLIVAGGDKYRSTVSFAHWRWRRWHWTEVTWHSGKDSIIHEFRLIKHTASTQPVCVCVCDKGWFCNLFLGTSVISVWAAVEDTHTHTHRVLHRFSLLQCSPQRKLHHIPAAMTTQHPAGNSAESLVWYWQNRVWVCVCVCVCCFSDRV